MLGPTKRANRIQVRTVQYPYEGIPDFYTTFLCDRGSVSEVLREEIPWWNNRNPVMIDAPTGYGKTTFVYDVLLEDAKRKGKNTLILSNRIALSAQQKREIIRRQGSNLDRLLTEEGLRQHENFGDVCVLTYHRLPAFLKDPDNEKWLRDVLYVVADECHFFVADSVFNGSCDYCLKLLTSRFHQAIRVYLTATSWDCLVPLAEAERKNWIPFGTQAGREFIRYRFPEKQRNLSVSFFTDENEILAQIQRDDKSKWLVFVDSREAGKRMQARLGVCAAYIDAESKGSASWNRLISESAFSEKVMITTAVLDCGVNILDDALQNIVLFTDDRTKFMQMLGRKRCKAGEKINLWVQVPGAKKIEARLQSCREKLTWLERYGELHTKAEFDRMTGEILRTRDPDLHDLFRFGDGRLYRNELAWFYLSKRERFLTGLAEGSDFRDFVYDWLGMERPDSPGAQGALGALYEDWGETALSGEQMDTLRNAVVTAYLDAGNAEPQPKRLHALGARALNNRLQDLGLPYEIEENGGNWILRKVERKDAQ